MKINDFTITFWGVRGSRPVPVPETIKYGGITPCVEVRIGKRLIILDAGTGITNLGTKLMQEQGPHLRRYFYHPCSLGPYTGLAFL
jgi:phosphoribosyl 1,2-cyclic phosphodiesterase